MKFYCREQELKKMQQRYDADKFECIVIYGRRRVGKTALINKFCEDKKTVSFSALNAPATRLHCSKNICSNCHWVRQLTYL